MRGAGSRIRRLHSGDAIVCRLIQVRHGKGTKWPLEYSRKKWFLGPPKLPPEIVEWHEQVKQAEMDRIEATRPDVVPPQPRIRGSSHIAVTLPRVHALKKKRGLAARKEEDEEIAEEQEKKMEDKEEEDGECEEERRRKDEKLMDELVDYYRECAECGIVPEKSMGVKMAFKDYAYLFLQAGEDRDIVRGKWGHAHALSHGHRSNRYLGNCLMIMYNRCGYVHEAQKIFDDIVWKNVFTWTVLMKGYADFGEFERSVALFREMLARGEPANEYTFSCALTCLGALRMLEQGRVVHGIAREMSFSSRITAGNALISMYGKCGSIPDAKNVFDSMQERNVVTWNALIAAYAQNGLYREIEWLLPAMEVDGVRPNKISFMGISLAVPSFRDAFVSARQVHKRMFDLGLDLVGYTALVKMYGRCGQVEDAEVVFEGIPWKDVVAWTAMVTSFAQNGFSDRAFEYYRKMQLEGRVPNKITLLGIVDACDSAHRCREIRTRMERAPFQSDTSVKNALLSRFGRLGSIDDARDAFKSIGKRNLVSWNAMIFALVQHQKFEEVLDAYRQLQLDGEKADRISFIGVLDGCAMLEDLVEGKKAHRHVLEKGLSKDRMIRNALVNMYGRCSSVEKARQVFEKIEEKDIVSWNALASAAARHQLHDEVLELLREMDLEGVKADSITFIAVVGACGSLRAVREGTEVHGRIYAAGLLNDSEKSRKLKTALVDMYGKCGNVEAAKEVFSSIRGGDDIPWTAMMAASVGNAVGTLRLLQEMDLEGVKPSSIAYAVLLDAFTGPFALGDGEKIHARINERWLHKNALLSISLVNMYARCGCLEEARKVFEQQGDDLDSVVLWNSMLAAFISQGHGYEALELSLRMDLEGVRPSETTFVALLEACSLVTDRQRGDKLYRRFRRSGFAPNVIVDTALVNLHSISGGSLEDIRTFFDKMKVKTQVSWSSMISAYARRGLPDEALELLGSMIQLGLDPDGVTFISLLSGCSYGGLVDEACQCFYSLEHDHGLKPGVEHQRIMVDVLGRAGWLDEAEKMAGMASDEKNIEGGTGAWTSLLSSCRNFGDSERGARAAAAASQREPGRASSYLILSSIYAEEAAARESASFLAGNDPSSWGAACGEITPVEDDEDELISISKLARMGPRRPGKPDGLDA
ncbi:pentatricopeptide repeat-containing protein At2g39620 [Selaginella moellendorffii]|uniref:pentatricopeptide repeat-containing protein At2g39620 n=1 Tax=Selaginella moellendorffii TaxID=88036 RepID=UPI000D1C68A0|nr:pentatricopeptide repeat-containing protein At2g39620 [Selaginella moellendorffii]|eukprot:XP_002964429.2 pentatricopeptide repeat-containing protein At2g39620 [Selaginella moellendorffii]